MGGADHRPATYDAIVAHAKRDHPDEACGIVAGPRAATARAASRWSTPPVADVLRVRLHRPAQLYKEMDRDEEPVSSTTRTRPRGLPSRTDIGLASEPNAHYVLVSTREHGNNEGPVEFRSYRIVDGEVTEEEVTVVDELPSRATEESHPWPSRSGSRPSCAPTPAARRPSRRRRQPERPDRRPGGQPPRHQGPPDRRKGGDLRRFVNVYVNDEDVRFIGGLEAELSDGDQVVVLPAVAGGC